MCFNTKFDNLLTERLQKKGFNCLLRNRYNWFNRKKTGGQWSGKFKCVAKVLKLDDNLPVEIHVVSLGYSNHSKLKIPERISGDERQTMGSKLVVHGVESTLEQNEIDNFLSSSGI